MPDNPTPHAQPATGYARADHHYPTLILGGVHHLPTQARAALGRQLSADARAITNEQLRQLFSDAWPARITAAWLAGLDRRTQLRPVLAHVPLATDILQ